jgi:hypothetical protein
LGAPIDDARRKTELTDAPKRFRRIPGNDDLGACLLQRHLEIERNEGLLLDDEDSLSLEIGAIHSRGSLFRRSTLHANPRLHHDVFHKSITPAQNALFLRSAAEHDGHGSGALRPVGGGNASGGSTGDGAAPAGADRRSFMRASVIPIALTLTLAPLPASPFDQHEFCAAVTDIARRMNARKGRWLDRSTRHDGVELDCDAKTLEANRFIDADPDEMREGWQARKEREWNARYCNDESWREAIDNGWSIVSTLTFRTGEQVSFAAECD